MSIRGANGDSNALFKIPRRGQGNEIANPTAVFFSV